MRGTPADGGAGADRAAATVEVESTPAVIAAATKQTVIRFMGLPICERWTELPGRRSAGLRIRLVSSLGAVTHLKAGSPEFDSGRPLVTWWLMELRIGSFTPAAPVVLAPMAGVTNAPFRALCRRFGPGLVYVNEMVMATAVVHGNAKTDQMMTFGPDEQPRSLQLYGSDPEMMGRAVDRICRDGGSSTTSTSTSDARPPR